LRRFYDVSYVNGRYVIQIIPYNETIGFYTDEKKRRRPIKRRRGRRVKEIFKVVSPTPKNEAEKIVRRVSYSRSKPDRILNDWWIPEAEQLYNHLRKHGSRLTPIEVMALFNEVKKRRPEWDYTHIYEYLDKTIDPSLTYSENKTFIERDLGRTEEELKDLTISMYGVKKPKDYINEERKIEELYQAYLNDIKNLELEEASPTEYTPPEDLYIPPEYYEYTGEVDRWY